MSIYFDRIIIGDDMNILKKILKVLGIILLAVILFLIVDYIRLNIRYFIHKDEYEEVIDIHGNKGSDVPQGLSYSEKYDAILQTSYSKEVSKLYVVDFTNNKLLKEYNLINMNNSNNTKHVGGVTTDDSYVWISNDYELDIYDMNTVMNSDVKELKPLKEIKIPLRGDFCYYHDGILWIGDFYLKPFYTVPNDDPLLYGYKIKEEINYEKPDYIIHLPKMVQGMTILPDGRFVFTSSFTNLINSGLSIYKNVLEENKDEYRFDKNNLIENKKIPPMAEGIFYKDGYIHILFENSSDKYFFAYPKINKIVKYKID